jgi:choline dehydrogenase-like flavoprotein
MPVHEFNQEPAETREAEVLIVGAGAVGLVLGIALARLGRRVTILEAGPPSYPRDFESRNAGPSRGVLHQGIGRGRMKALGGTTRLWGGQLVPFGRVDVEGVTYEGKRVWPISFAELQNYTQEALSFLGVPADLADQDHVWKARTGAAGGLGSNLKLGMNLWLKEPDFTKLFAKELDRLPTLSIVTDAEVRTLRFAGTGRVEEALVPSPNGGNTSFRGRSVVLAAGTLENCRLLLQASQQESSPLAGNPHLGRGFIDHLHCFGGTVRVIDRVRAQAMFDGVFFNGHKYGVKIRGSEEFRTGRRLAACSGQLVANQSIGGMVRDVGLLVRRLRPSPRQVTKLVSELFNAAVIILPFAWRYVMERRSPLLVGRGVQLGLEIEQIPTAQSYVFLDPDASAGTARVGVAWDFDGRELDAAAEFCLELKAELEGSGLAQVEIDPLLLSRSREFFAKCHDASHHMGGAVMSHSRDDGVVDANLRVHGSSNLFVLGAAVFPSGSYANPTLTAIALALRLAHHLQEKPT